MTKASKVEPKLKVEYVDTDSLIPYVNNAKLHPPEQVAQIAASIKSFGFVNPILIDAENTVIAGHGRLLGATKLKMKQVPVVRLEHLTESQRKAYIIADNKLTTNTGFDTQLLKLEMDSLKAMDFDLSLTGFTLDEISDLQLEIASAEEDKAKEEIEDDVPEVEQNKFNVKRGQVWKLGNHRIMCGDSTSEADVAKLMNGQKADMVFTDPPYGMNLDTDFSKMNWNGDTGKTSGGKKYKKVIGDDKEFNPNYILNIFNYVDEIFLWGADWYSFNLPKHGSFFVWDKRLNNDTDHSLSHFELCWSKQLHRREIIPITWFRFFGLQNEDTNTRIHPNQKPTKLIEWFLTKYSIDNQVIVDLFLGSGSTLIACEKTNRICYGMELDEHYCSVIIQRWQDYTGLKAELLKY